MMVDVSSQKNNQGEARIKMTETRCDVWRRAADGGDPNGEHVQQYILLEIVRLLVEMLNKFICFGCIFFYQCIWFRLKCKKIQTK